MVYNGKRVKLPKQPEKKPEEKPKAEKPRAKK